MRRDPVLDDDPMCRLSGLCDGVLPLAGSLFGLLALLAVLAL